MAADLGGVFTFFALMNAKLETVNGVSWQIIKSFFREMFLTFLHFTFVFTICKYIVVYLKNNETEI